MNTFNHLSYRANQESDEPMTAYKNVLYSDIEIEGDLKFSHDLIFDGKLTGSISSGSRLVIGENAVIVGDIVAGSIQLQGKVQGNIKALTRCEIKTQALIFGDLTTPLLIMEEGASFVGQSRNDGEDAHFVKQRLPFDRSLEASVLESA